MRRAHPHTAHPAPWPHGTPPHLDGPLAVQARRQLLRHEARVERRVAAAPQRQVSGQLLPTAED